MIGCQKFTRIGIIVLALSRALPGQNYLAGETAVARYTGMPVYQPGNPAWNYLAYHGPTTRYQIDVQGLEGDYHLPFEPAADIDQTWTASGTQALGGRQVFEGSFSYHRRNISDKLWVHGRQPYNGIPFLLADSSVGGFNLNGIHWQTDYSFELWPQLLYGGVRLYYNVDESYKTVFPRSKINTRDLVAGSGLGFQPAAGLRVGISAVYFDLQEQDRTSKYSLDQALTPIFFKIRGLDNPLIFHGKTSEERSTTITGHSVEIDTRLGGDIGPVFEGRGGYEAAAAHLLDGGSYPEEQGRWYGKRIFYDVAGHYESGGRWRLGCFSAGEEDTQTADHPDLKIKIYDSRIRSVSGGFDLIWRPVNDRQVSGRIYADSQSRKRVDRYNGIVDYFPAVGWGLDWGAQIRLYNRLQVSLAGGRYWKETRDSAVITEREDFYYSLVTTAEQEYLDNNYTAWMGKIAISWYSVNLLKFTLSGNYQLIDPNYLDSFNFTAVDRRILRLSLVIERLDG
ncbi:MAG: DUF6850 family outer membrane beta-barrel protein [Candidatus Neomarinimicrobiota bacterium]